MPEPQISQLLDRAVHHAPPVHLTGEAMLAAGKGRVRRRRAVGVGGTLAAAAVVAAVWGGLGGGSGLLTGTTEIQPATTVWEPGETVEGTLFTGLQTVDQEQVGHSYAAELSRTSGDGPVTLLLSDADDVVEEIASSTPVPGLDVFEGERMTVAVWREPEGVRASVPLVGPRDPGGPANVQHAEVGGEEFAYAVWSADVVPLPEEVVDVYLLGRRAVTLSGAPVEWSVSRTAGHRLHAFVGVGRGVVGYAVDDEEPVLTQLGHQPAQVFSSGGLSTDGTETRVMVLPEGSEVEGTPDEDERGVDWIATKLHARPVVMVVREDAGERPPSDVEFTLGGQSWTFSSYAQDLRQLEVEHVASLEVVAGEEPGQVALWRDGSSAPEVTFVPLDGEVPTVTHRVAGSLVTVVRRWETGAGVLTESRVEVTQNETATWVEPADVAQVVLPNGQTVTLLSLPAEPGSEVTGVGTAVDGAVERAEWGDADGARSGPADASAPSATLETADGTTFTLWAEGSDLVARSGDDTYRTTVDPLGGPLATLLGECRPVFLVPG